MSAIGGPTSSLPGAVLFVPANATCDKHPKRPAVKRVQGETDSMGFEATDMCQQCYDKYLKEKPNLNTSGVCDWCGHHKQHRRPRRDYDEGTSGPVYMVCDGCIDKENERAAEELAEDSMNDLDWY
jgi:hypothetical protein